MNKIPNSSQYSVEAGLVADRLSALDKGDQITYAELTTAAGIDVVKYRHILTTARRKLLIEEHKVFRPVTKIGLVRLSDDEIASSGISVVKKIRKAARRGVQVVGAVDYGNLSDRGRTNHAIGMTILNLVQHGSSAGNLRHIEAAAQGQKVLPLDETLKLIGK